MAIRHRLTTFFWGLIFSGLSTGVFASDQARLILRVDDIGMTHATNQGLADLAALNIPFAASVMFTTPWYQEGVEILKANPHISVGVHLTLNAEWRHYRWGPIAGRNEVPSLINDTGYFYPSTAQFLEQQISLDEVRLELEAQIQRALATGLNIAYVDYHMRTALATPELLAVVTGLAQKYELRMSMRMGEAVTTMFDVPIEEKQSRFLSHLKNSLEKDKVNVLVIHAARNQPEMQALIDLNNATMNTAEMEPLVALHRGSELDMLLSPEFAEFTRGDDIEFINYHMTDNPFSQP
ncbi:ChbG/HpnK family deacetylase [Gilvimarinus sp. SDUM040013]|uniref:ChbG/HpnK family deacetylase n=1 Tax=Gilvimarinus gilvus TaxID=3058038 RepID=A0ABU4RYT7_9GAMM|nr:ChbG/HpnK family deacetylase [Gilvimarinus sp. SDUM040013]MDO3384600.1 ChbG/HpnK family deacetylase [Gilvimarinus sp. SDUM040013]MDX6850064.1 ChbG/HpnK family deacetylase [Gilvimarinus sp. SDUM040013]